MKGQTGSNPPLAYQALEADGDIGLLLLCNGVVQEGSDGMTAVEGVDPAVQLGVAGGEDLEPLAEEVRSRLVRVLNRTEEGTP